MSHGFVFGDERYKAGADAVKQAHADEQEDQDIAGQIGIDVDYNGVQCRFQRL